MQVCIRMITGALLFGVATLVVMLCLAGFVTMFETVGPAPRATMLGNKLVEFIVPFALVMAAAGAVLSPLFRCNSR